MLVIISEFKENLYIMAQFRLTNKFARDLKISLDKSPTETFHPLDDWVGDVFQLGRKKVALLSQAKTFISFIFPYAEVGGAKNILEFLPIEIDEYLRDLNLESWVESTLLILNQPHVFTKTENRKVLGHMNDFKQCILVSCYGTETIHWHKISAMLKEVPIKMGTSYETPRDLLVSSLNKSPDKDLEQNRISIK
jgi:hypothetical protein